MHVRIVISNFQRLFLQQLKTKQLYNHYQKVSMSILSITIYGFFDLLIQACKNCPIDFKLGIMIPNTVRNNLKQAVQTFLIVLYSFLLSVNEEAELIKDERFHEGMESSVSLITRFQVKFICWTQQFRKLIRVFNQGYRERTSDKTQFKAYFNTA